MWYWQLASHSNKPSFAIQSTWKVFASEVLPSSLAEGDFLESNVCATVTSQSTSQLLELPLSSNRVSSKGGVWGGGAPALGAGSQGVPKRPPQGV